MSIKICGFVLILIMSLIKAENLTDIDKYRQDFMHQLKNKIPFQDILNLQNNAGASNDQEEMVLYYLYTNRNPKKGIVITHDTRPLNPRLPIKLLVHGWTEAYDVLWMKKITAAYLKKGHYNILILDWSKKGNANYLLASRSVKEVGDAVGDYIINKLVRERKVPVKNIHMISHSLGCHVAGMIGQRVIELIGSRVGRITALDPAAPIFDLFTVGNNDRLSSDDAKFVDILHTDGGNLGFKYSIGTADFFPNGGFAIQPGCSLAKQDVQYQDLFCSHARSHMYYLRSIYLMELIAIPCDSWEMFNKGSCDQHTPVYFGDAALSNSTGNYYFKLPEEPMQNLIKT